METFGFKKFILCATFGHVFWSDVRCKILSKWCDINYSAIDKLKDASYTSAIWQTMELWWNDRDVGNIPATSNWNFTSVPVSTRY